MTSQEIKELEERLIKAKKELEEGPLNIKLSQYIEKFKGKVILYTHKSTGCKSLYFCYYKDFYINTRYRDKKYIYYKGEILQISTSTHDDTIRLNKKEDSEVRDFYDMYRENDPNYKIISLEEYQRYRNACPKIIQILHTDILGNDKIEE